MANPSLRAREREVEAARTKLTEDLAVLCSPSILADFRHGLKQEVLESGDRLWQKLKAQAAANPAAVMAIAAGLGWRFMKRPPIASSLIGLGLFSLWRTAAKPLDARTSFFRQSAHSLKDQGAELASALGETAARAKDTIAEKSAETWDSTKDKIQEWTEQAGEQLVETRSKAKSAGENILDSVRRQQHDLRDEIADAATAARETLRDQDTRNIVLIGIAGVAVAAAVGIAAQKRMAEPAEANLY
jgi:hypothetical protein